MVSLRGRIVRRVIRKNFNMNPESVPSAVPYARKVEKLNSERPPAGFKRERKVTESGAAYEIFTPKKGKSDCTIYYFHGGGYIAKLNAMYRKLSKQLSRAGKNATVVLLDYRCAPEYTYPTQLTEAYDVWQTLVKDGFSAENMMVGGNSAGGNLTLAFLLKLRDLGEPMPFAAFCISPWTDLTASGQSYYNNYSVDVMFGGKRSLDEESKKQFLESDIYSFAGKEDRTNPYVSPIFGDYSGFPPMYFAVGGHEVLLDDTLTVAEKLRNCGVETHCDITDGMFHIFPLFYGLFPEATRAFRLIKEFIGKQCEKKMNE